MLSAFAADLLLGGEAVVECELVEDVGVGAEGPAAPISPSAAALALAAHVNVAGP